MSHRRSALAASVLLFVASLLHLPIAARAESAVGVGLADTFNVVRLGTYPNDFDGIFADGNRAMLNDSFYDWETPPDSYGYAHLYSISDPQNPVFVSKMGNTAQTIGDMYVAGDILALALSGKSYYSSLGELSIYSLSNAREICHTYFDYDRYGMTYSAVLRDQYAFVGVARGLAVVDFSHPDAHGQCPPATLFPSAAVYEIAEAGTQLYLAQAAGVRLVNVAAPLAPSEVGFYPTPKTVYELAVSPANYIYAAGDYGLDIIDGASGQIVTHYGPTSTVTVAVDGTKAFVGTRDDLQVLDVSNPRTPQLVGRYADPDMDFERGLSFSDGLVHSPKGIFQYRPDLPALLLEAQSAGIAVNGQPLVSGSSRVIEGGERITVETSIGKVYFNVRCTANGSIKRTVQIDKKICQWCRRQPSTAVQVVDDLLTLAEFAAIQCPLQAARLTPQADPPALPFHLESGAVEVTVLTGVAAVDLDTAYAGSLTQGGSRLLAAHDPEQDSSQFACTAGEVEVQPHAPAAPSLILKRGESVWVTADGAGPVGYFGYTHLPLAVR